MAQGQEWIEIAADLHSRLEHADKRERQRVMADAHARLGREPHTLRRMVKAYEYVLRRAKPLVADLSEIRAPVVSIEVLMRLERKAPSLAAELLSDVFGGRITFRKLLRLERELPTGRATSEDMQSGWNAFAIEVLDELHGWSRASSAFNPEREGYSDLAKLLKVDWEVGYGEDASVAIYLSPQMIYSTGRGRPLEEHLARAFMAMSFFDEVTFLAWDEAEKRAVESYLNRARHPERMRLTVKAYSELSAGRAGAFDIHSDEEEEGAYGPPDGPG